MPITQDRMIAIVNAGIDCDEGRTKIIKAIEQAWKNVKDGGITPFSAIEGLRLEFMYDTAGLSNSKSPDILALEAAWFKRFAKVNDRERRKRNVRKAGGRGQSESPLPAPHPTTLARVRIAQEILDKARNLQELEKFENECKANVDTSFKIVDSTRCAACGHAWAVHLPEFKGCGVCGCECQPPECQPAPAPTPSPVPSDAESEPEPSSGGFNRFAEEDAEEDERIARQRAEFAAARAKAQARKTME